MARRDVNLKKTLAASGERAYRDKMKAIRKPDRRVVERIALKAYVFALLKQGTPDALARIEDFETVLYQALVHVGYEPRHVADRLEQIFDSLRQDHLRAQIDASVEASIAGKGS